MDAEARKILEQFGDVALSDRGKLDWMNTLRLHSDLRKVSPWIVWDKQLRNSENCVFWRSSYETLLNLVQDKLRTPATAIGLFHGSKFGTQRVGLAQILSTDSEFIEGIAQLSDDVFVVLNHSGMVCVCVSSVGIRDRLLPEARRK